MKAPDKLDPILIYLPGEDAARLEAISGLFQILHSCLPHSLMSFKLYLCRMLYIFFFNLAKDLNTLKTRQKLKCSGGHA